MAKDNQPPQTNDNDKTDIPKTTDIDQLSRLSDVRTAAQTDRIGQYRQIYEQYQEEKANYLKLYQIFHDNLLVDDFTYSRRSALALIILPAALNLYYLWKPYSPMKNLFRFGSVIGCFLHYNYALKRDFKELCKKDTELANKARLYAQNISMHNLTSRSFQKDTQQVYGKR